MRWMVAMGIWALASATAWGQPVQTFTIGLGGESWESGGASIDPEILRKVGSRTVADTTNTPEDAIEFVHRRGWISPLFFDPEVNIASRVLLERGKISAPNSLHEARSIVNRWLEGTVNGDHEAAYQRKPTLTFPDANANGIWIILDFGILTGIHRVRFYPRNALVETPSAPFHDDFMRGYELWVNERQTNTAQNAPDFLIVRQARNEEAIVDLPVPSQYVRLVKLRSIAVTPFEIDEIEVYGTGYLSEAVYYTDLIDLGGRATVGRARWTERAVGGASFSSVSVRVRTGNDDTPVLYRRDGIGEFGDPFIIEVTGEEYHQLERFEQAPLVDDEENWSPWKSAENGALVTAPGPRSYIQFRLDFKGRIFDTRQVARLQFDYLQPPIADTLRAEVFPRLAEAEKPATFRYAVRLRSAGPVRGYDRLEVDTNIQVAEIRGLQINGRPTEFEVVENKPELFTLEFPLIDGDGDLLEFTFDLPIFRFGSTFSGRAFNSRWPQVPQILEPGNAIAFGPEDIDELSGLSVAIPRSQVGQLLGEIALSPRVLTPNGDGVNDEMEIFFNLLQLTLPTPVAFEIYDLAGRKVQTVFAEDHRLGPALHRWDGRSMDGKLLAPGLYVWVLRVEADAFAERHCGTIGVAY
ncbi:MAG: hypothetical protein CME20_22910 [Gemmatimonadetes bacterium]|nr:hypothetical protein [Gemmatimonadota bacterium]